MDGEKWGGGAGGSRCVISFYIVFVLLIFRSPRPGCDQNMSTADSSGPGCAEHPRIVVLHTEKQSRDCLLTPVPAESN